MNFKALILKETEISKKGWIKQTEKMCYISSFLFMPQG